MPFSRTFQAWKSQQFNSMTFHGLYEPCCTECNEAQTPHSHTDCKARHGLSNADADQTWSVQQQKYHAPVASDAAEKRPDLAGGPVTLLSSTLSNCSSLSSNAV